MKSNTGSVRKYLPIYLAAIVLFVLAISGYRLVPRTLALYHQIIGGQILQDVITTSPGINSEDFLCFQDPLTDAASRAKILGAIQHLQVSVQYNSDLAHAYLLLGRAYCLKGELTEASLNFRRYIDIRPKNPLGYLELGIAYSKSGNNVISVHDLKEIRIYYKDCLDRAKFAHSNERYDEAYRWHNACYRISNNYMAPDFFLWGVDAILSGHQIPDYVSPAVLPVINLDTSTRIEAESLHWMLDIKAPDYVLNFGDPLIKIPGGDLNLGVMWFPGTAVAIIKTPCSTSYTFRMRAKHHDMVQDVSGLIILSDNFDNLNQFQLSSDWQEYKTNVRFTNGLHIIGIEYKEDVGDAILDWIQFDRVHKCETP